jgi:hypothetical protein
VAAGRSHSRGARTGRAIWLRAHDRDARYRSAGRSGPDRAAQARGSFVAQPRIESAVLGIPDIPATIAERGKAYDLRLLSARQRVAAAGARKIALAAAAMCWKSIVSIWRMAFRSHSNTG